MRLSPRTRLTLFFTGLFSLVLALTLGTIYGRVSKSLHRDFREEMVHDGRLIAEWFKEEMSLNAIDEFQEEIEEFGIELVVLSSSGTVVAESDGWKRLDIEITPEMLAEIQEAPSFRELTLDGKPAAIFSRTVNLPASGRYTLHTVRSQEGLKATVGKLRLWMLIVAPIVILLSALAGFLFSSRTLEVEQRAFDRLKAFTADAAHELRIPLTALRGHLEVALRRERTPAEYKETIAAALDEAEHLSGFMQDLLLLAQSDAARLQVKLQDVDVRAFLTEVHAQLAAMPSDRGITVALGAVAPVTARFDPERIRQLLFNLADNAIKYGVPNGHVVLEAAAAGPKLKLVVKDDGIGIPEGEREKIFDRFYRVDKARSRELGGSGLGLSIVRSIVEAHDGTVTVESELGKGSTFTVWLPGEARPARAGV